MGIKNTIFEILPERVKIEIFKKKYFNNPCGFGEPFSDTLNKAFDVFLTKEEKENKKVINKMTSLSLGLCTRLCRMSISQLIFDMLGEIKGLHL